MSARYFIAGDKQQEELLVGRKLSRWKLSETCWVIMLSAVGLLAASPASATAQWHRRKTSHASHPKKAYTRSVAGGQLYKAALLEDADSGRVLMSTNADMDWPPASMAKMMLL